jgi:hypothetical protein
VKEHVIRESQFVTCHLAGRRTVGGFATVRVCWGFAVDDRKD